MQRKNEISEELRQLSMVVAGLDRNTPYGIPDGYFASFPETMLQRLDKEDAPAETPAPEWGKGPAFSVPSGYFDSFASSLMDRIKAGQQASSPASRVTATPAEELAALSPLLNGISRSMPFEVPQDYFGSLSPMLATLKDRSVYTVPEGYFERLPDAVMSRIHPASSAATTPAKAAKVVPMGSSSRKWWQYAAAAVVVAFIGSIGWLRFHTPANKPGLSGVDVTQGLAKVSDQELGNYVDNHTVQLAQVEQELDLANSTASLDFSENDIRSLLGDVSDNDLTQYMEEHGNLKDYPTN